MFPTNHENQIMWEAFLDGELEPQEASALEAQLENDPQLQEAVAQLQEESGLLRHHLREEVNVATDLVDFDQFYAQLSSQIEAQTSFEPSIPVQEESTTSLFAQWFGWFQSHPGISLAFASAVAVAVIFSLPFLDPGPDANDCIVEKVTSDKASQVAVLQTKNSATGQRMTVIVVNEPPKKDKDKDDDDDSDLKQKKPKKRPVKPNKGQP